MPPSANSGTARHASMPGCREWVRIPPVLFPRVPSQTVPKREVVDQFAVSGEGLDSRGVGGFVLFNFMKGDSHANYELGRD